MSDDYHDEYCEVRGMSGCNCAERLVATRAGMPLDVHVAVGPEAIDEALESEDFPTLEHVNAMGCTLTVKSKGNCLELTVPEGWRMVIDESKDGPGRLTWIWMERER